MALCIVFLLRIVINAVARVIADNTQNIIRVVDISYYFEFGYFSSPELEALQVCLYQK